MLTQGGMVLKVSKDNSKDVYISHLATQSVVQGPATLVSPTEHFRSTNSQPPPTIC